MFLDVSDARVGRKRPVAILALDAARQQLHHLEAQRVTDNNNTCPVSKKSSASKHPLMCHRTGEAVHQLQVHVCLIHHELFCGSCAESCHDLAFFPSLGHGSPRLTCCTLSAGAPWSDRASSPAAPCCCFCIISVTAAMSGKPGPDSGEFGNIPIGMNSPETRVKLEAQKSHASLCQEICRLNCATHQNAFQGQERLTVRNGHTPVLLHSRCCDAAHRSCPAARCPPPPAAGSSR